MNPIYGLLKEARELATAEFENAAGLDTFKDVRGSVRYWNILKFHIETKLAELDPKPTGPGPMTREQVEHFEKMEVPFGKYKGEEIREVPTSYLEFLAGEDTFVEQVRRYLPHRHKTEVE